MENIRTYVLQILGEHSPVEKDSVIEAFKQILPEDKNFTLHVAELQSMEVDGNKISGVYL